MGLRRWKDERKLDESCLKLTGIEDDLKGFHIKIHAKILYTAKNSKYYVTYPYQIMIKNNVFNKNFG